MVIGGSSGSSSASPALLEHKPAFFGDARAKEVNLLRRISEKQEDED